MWLTRCHLQLNSVYLDNFESFFFCRTLMCLMVDINMIALKNNCISNKYLDLIQSEGFSQLTPGAIRITEPPQSGIDHIWFSLINYSTSCSNGTLAVEIADHALSRLPFYAFFIHVLPFSWCNWVRDVQGFDNETLKSDIKEEIGIECLHVMR